MNEFIIKVLIGFVFGCIYIAYFEWRRNKKYRENENKWKEQSFEYQGGRYNKDFYQLINGELKEVNNGKENYKNNLTKPSTRKAWNVFPSS